MLEVIPNVEDGLFISEALPFENILCLMYGVSQSELNSRVLPHLICDGDDKQSRAAEPSRNE